MHEMSDITVGSTGDVKNKGKRAQAQRVKVHIIQPD